MVCDLANTVACDLDLWVVVYGPWIHGLWSKPWSMTCDLDNTMACDLDPWSVTLAHMVCGLWTWVCDLVSGL